MTDFLTSVKFWMVKLFRFPTGQSYFMCVHLVLVFWITLLASGNCLSISSQEAEPPALLKELHAECNPQGIQVRVWFKKPFAGVAYSHGHYETTKCRYIQHEDVDENSEKDEDKTNKAMESRGTNFSFLIPMNECGTVYYEGASGKVQKDARANKSNEYEVYIENTLLIQNDPTIQEAGDVAKTLRCVWQKQIRQPLMASLPIGNVKMPPSKLFGAIPQRVKTITTTMHKSRPFPEQKDSLSSNSSQPTNNNNNNARLNLRFQKKGQVHSVPFHERRHHSRAMDMEYSNDEDDRDASSENYAKVFLESDLVSALPLQRQYNVASLAAAGQKPTQRFSFVFCMTLIMFSIPARI